MSNVRTMTDEENARVCAQTAKLMELYNSQAELGAALRMPDGSSISQTVVSQALRGGPVGYAFARAVAQRIGMTLEELLTGVVGRQRYKDLPGWEDAARKVTESEFLPAYVVKLVGEGFVAFPIEEMSPNFVYDLGMFWIKYAPIAEKKAAEKARILEDEKRLREEEERRYERNRSGQVEIDRRSHVAPLRKSTENR